MMAGPNFRLLVNAGLLILPVATTLGVLLGMQKHRHSTGQPPLFTDNGVTESQYCQKSYGIEVDTKGQEYTLNPNQWGWDEGEPGHLCVDVTTFNNKTYPTRTTAPEFSITWQYPPGPETQPVHAFPNIQVEGSVFPVSLESVKQIDVDLEWTYGVGDKPAATTDAQELTANSVNTNVAIDMFLDSDKVKAKDSAKATYEVMVWFASIGPATQPIGLQDGKVASKTINGVAFSLYFGKNGQDQYVLTWLASEVTSNFNGDIAPLVSELLTSNKENFPTSSDYLGYMGLGSEALSADKNVTLHVPTLSIDVQASAGT